MGVSWFGPVSNTTTTATPTVTWQPVVPVEDAASAVHHTGTEDSAWDAGAARKNMPNDPATLKYCHAWYDPSGDPENKASYKFPHHRTKGGPANMAAVRNGLARLSGANIDGKDGVEAHLRAHLKDGGGGEDHVHRLPVDQRLLTTVTGWLRNRDARPRPPHGKDRPSLQLVDRADGADMLIYDEIGFWGITAGDVADSLGKVRGSLNVRINSPGGDVFDGIAIYNMLLDHPDHVTVSVDGLAASAASFIAMAGDVVEMKPASQMMIHDASGLVLGNAADMTEMAATLDRISDTIAQIYAARAGGDVTDWRDAMRAETWFSADEAVAARLADTAPTKKGPMRPGQPDEPAPPDEDPDEDKEPVAAKYDLRCFQFAGRDHAPTPAMPNQAVSIDSASIREAMKGAFR
jgi:ATP-dependent protease ClpP protease subunit